MTHGSLFTGIGGIDLGFEWAGIETLWQVENDEYCNKVLEMRFPNVRRYKDVRNCHSKEYLHNTPKRKEEMKELPNVDIVSGGFP